MRFETIEDITRWSKLADEANEDLYVTEAEFRTMKETCVDNDEPERWKVPVFGALHVIVGTRVIVAGELKVREQTERLG